MAELRDALEQVVGSLPYRAWGATSPIDAGKVSYEMQGIRRPLPGSAFAQGLVRLARLDPPVAVSPLASLWRADACFTSGALSNFAGPARARARATGWQVVYVQLAHTAYAVANEAELPVFLAEGWMAVGWGTYGQGSDPYQDGLGAAKICKRLGSMRGWKANGEDWAEAEHAWKTAEFVRGWKAGGAPVPLGWSVLSSTTGNYARAFDYQAALAVAGADIDAQVYGASNPGYTVAAAAATLDRASVPADRRAMSFDVDAQGSGPFADYLTWRGPRRLWNPDRATVATFDALAR